MRGVVHEAYARSTRGATEIPAEEPLEGSVMPPHELPFPPKRFNNIVSLSHQAAVPASKVQPI